MSFGNGHGSTPPHDHLGTQVAVLAIDLLSKIQSKTILASSLTIAQRQACVRHLWQDGTVTDYDMARILEVAERTIRGDKKKLREGHQLSDLVIDEGDIAQDLIHEANVACAKLRKAGKWDKAFDVRDKCIERLQSMGFIKKVAKDINIKGSLSILEVLDLEHELSSAESGSGGFEDTAATGGGERFESP